MSGIFSTHQNDACIEQRHSVSNTHPSPSDQERIVDMNIPLNRRRSTRLASAGVFAAGTLIALLVHAGTDVVQIHLDQYNGYFAAQETLAGLKPGTYEFIVTNKAGKLAGFQLQDEHHKQLDMFPLEPGESRTTRIEIDAGGFRYRCPINPTPWYEVDVAAAR